MKLLNNAVGIVIGLLLLDSYMKIGIFVAINVLIFINQNY